MIADYVATQHGNQEASNAIRASSSMGISSRYAPQTREVVKDYPEGANELAEAFGANTMNPAWTKPYKS